MIEITCEIREVHDASMSVYMSKESATPDKVQSATLMLKTVGAPKHGRTLSDLLATPGRRVTLFIEDRDDELERTQHDRVKFSLVSWGNVLISSTGIYDCCIDGTSGAPNAETSAGIGDGINAKSTSSAMVKLRGGPMSGLEMWLAPSTAPVMFTDAGVVEYHPSGETIDGMEVWDATTNGVVAKNAKATKCMDVCLAEYYELHSTATDKQIRLAAVKMMGEPAELEPPKEQSWRDRPPLI